MVVGGNWDGMGLEEKCRKERKYWQGNGMSWGGRQAQRVGRLHRLNAAGWLVVVGAWGVVWLVGLGGLALFCWGDDDGGRKRRMRRMGRPLIQ
jgi:hypothetical protein